MLLGQEPRGKYPASEGRGTSGKTLLQRPTLSITAIKCIISETSTFRASDIHRTRSVLLPAKQVQGFLIRSAVHTLTYRHRDLEW